MALTQVPIELSSTPGIVDNSNATAITIDSSENVGMGASSPAAKLHVSGSFGSQFRLQETGGTYFDIAAGGRFDLKNAAGTTIVSIAQSGSPVGTQLNLDSSGNLLVGRTSTPPTADAKIAIAGTGNTAVQITKDGVIAGRVMAVTTGLAFGVDGSDGATERMRIDSGGNLLVGKTGTGDYVTGFEVQPAGAVLAYRTNGVASIFGRTNDGEITRFTTNSQIVGSINAGSGNVLAISQGSTYIQFHNALNSFYASDGSGGRDNAIDIGASGVRFKDLYLSGGISVRTATENGTAQFKTLNSNTSEPNEQFYVGNNLSDVDLGNKRGGLKFFTAATERMRIDGSGNLLVGTTSAPTGSTGGSGFITESVGRKTLKIASTTTGGAGLAEFINPNGIVGSIATSGSSTAYNTSSDQRLKENIADADDAGSKVDAIQVRKFDWIADGSHQDYGVIAQELQTVAPEAVSAPEDPEEMMGVDYSKLVPMLVKEIQSLRARVQQLENN